MKDGEDILDELGEVAAVNTDEIERSLWQQVIHRYTYICFYPYTLNRAGSETFLLVYMQAEEATGTHDDKGMRRSCQNNMRGCLPVTKVRLILHTQMILTGIALQASQRRNG